MKLDFYAASIAILYWKHKTIFLVQFNALYAFAQVILIASYFINSNPLLWRIWNVSLSIHPSIIHPSTGSPQITTICLAIVQNYDGTEQEYLWLALEVAAVTEFPWQCYCNWLQQSAVPQINVLLAARRMDWITVVMGAPLGDLKGKIADRSF